MACTASQRDNHQIQNAHHVYRAEWIYAMKQNRYRSQIAGTTIVEALVACAITSMLIFTLLSIASAVAQSNDKQLVEIPLAGSGRTTIDEMLFQLRGAKAILPSQTIGGTKYVSDSDNIVFSAPAYNDKASDTSDVQLPGNTTDTVAFSFDAAKGNLYETIAPQAGSARKTRTKYLLARKVVDVTYTYYAHEHYHFASPSILNKILSLKASWPPGSSPTVKVLVNGDAAVNYLMNPDQALHLIALVNIPQGKTDVDIFYIVDGASGATIPFDVVTKVDATVTIRDTDSRLVKHTFTIAGSANLRNERTTTDES
jgi:hypothetical protein